MSGPNGNSTLPGAEANYTIRFTSETEYDIEVNGAVVARAYWMKTSVSVLVCPVV